MKERTIILRTAQHKLEAAFRSSLISAFIDGPEKAPPDVLFWRQRVFSFSTMDEETVSYTESFSYALIEGSTATPLSPEEMAKLPQVEPVAA